MAFSRSGPRYGSRYGEDSLSAGQEVCCVCLVSYCPSFSVHIQGSSSSPRPSPLLLFLEYLPCPCLFGEVSQHAHVLIGCSACPILLQTVSLTSPGKGRDLTAGEGLSLGVVCMVLFSEATTEGQQASTTHRSETDIPKVAYRAATLPASEATRQDKWQLGRKAPAEPYRTQVYSRSQVAPR